MAIWRVEYCPDIKCNLDDPNAGQEIPRFRIYPEDDPERWIAETNPNLPRDVQEEFARKAGLEWIYLDTYDDLKPAIAIYERRGYQRCERYNDNPQATLFMRKNIRG